MIYSYGRTDKHFEPIVLTTSLLKQAPWTVQLTQ